LASFLRRRNSRLCHWQLSGPRQLRGYWWPMCVTADHR
jgi:hypothetical protein